MTGPPFIDSNVLLYAYSDDPKSGIAKQIAAKPYVISVQILTEFANVSRRKLKLDWEVLELRLLAIKELADRILPISMETHLLGVQIARRYRLSVFDSMVVAATLLAECDTLYSEDMQNGLVIAGQLAIKNPFA